MGDAVSSGSQGAEELDGGADRDKRPHRNHDGKREDPNPAVGKQNGVGDEDAENCAGRAYRGDVTRPMSPEHGEHFNQNGNHSGADSAEKKVVQEAVPTPDHLEFTPKHPEKQHVEKKVEEAAVKEDVSYRLPDAQGGKWSERDESEMVINPKGGVAANQDSRQGLHKKNSRTRNNQILDARSDEAAPVETNARCAKRRAHSSSVKRGSAARQKELFLGTGSVFGKGGDQDLCRCSIRFITCQRTSRVKSTTTKHKIRAVEKSAIIEMSSSPPNAFWSSNLLHTS